MEKRIDIKNKDRPYQRKSIVCLLRTHKLELNISNKKIKMDSG